MCQIPSGIFDFYCRARTANNGRRRGIRAHHVVLVKSWQDSSLTRAQANGVFADKLHVTAQGLDHVACIFQGNGGMGIPTPSLWKSLERGIESPRLGRFFFPYSSSVNRCFWEREPRTTPVLTSLLAAAFQISRPDPTNDGDPCTAKERHRQLGVIHSVRRFKWRRESHLRAGGGE